MAAAPSRLLWEEWSVDYLDQIHPAIVSSGEDAGGCPPAWAGNLLAWNRVESSQLPTTMTGNRLVAISDGPSGDRVIYSIGGIPIDVRRSRSLSEFPIKVYKTMLTDTDDMDWIEIQPVGDYVPLARYGHSCVYHKGRIYMYGGRGNVRYNVFGDQGTIECFNIETNEWMELVTLVEGREYPHPRYGHVCVVDGSMMYIHGGHVLYSGNRWGFTSELISFNMETDTWRVESPHYAKHPPPHMVDAVVGKPPNYLYLHRDYHVGVFYDNKIIIIGGRTPENLVNISTSCLFYEFNITTRRWRSVEGTGYKPGHRNHMMGEKVGCFLIIYGGEPTHRWEPFHDDTFIVDLRTYYCTKLSLAVNVDVGRCASVSCVCGSNVIMYGGESSLRRDGSSIVYHNDFHILSLLPSLTQLCIEVIKSCNMDISLLPPRLRATMET